MRISDWSSDVCSSDLHDEGQLEEIEEEGQHEDQDVDDDQEAGFATRYTGQQVFDPEIAVDRAEDQAKTGRTDQDENDEGRQLGRGVHRLLEQRPVQLTLDHRTDQRSEERRVGKE